MLEIAANDLKTRGVGVIAEALRGDNEATISVRGKRRYVVMDLARYNQFREAELEAALREVQADLATCRVGKGGIAGHLRRMTAR